MVRLYHTRGTRQGQYTTHKSHVVPADLTPGFIFGALFLLESVCSAAVLVSRNYVIQ